MEKNEITLRTTQILLNQFLDKRNLRKGFVSIIKRDKGVNDFCIEYEIGYVTFKIFAGSSNKLHITTSRNGQQFNTIEIDSSELNEYVRKTLLNRNVT